MEYTKADFYGGHEGKPEVVFALTGPSGHSHFINAWKEYFDAIFTGVPPGPGPLGNWKGATALPAAPGWLGPHSLPGGHTRQIRQQPGPEGGPQAASEEAKVVDAFHAQRGGHEAV